MELDLITQLAIIARDRANEFQAVMMYASLAALAVTFTVLFVMKFAPVWDKVWKDFLHLDGFGNAVVSVCVCVAVMYGGAKHARVQNAGADEGITLAYIEYEVTNVVESVSVTNTFTTVDVAWTAGTVTTETPVRVRMTQTNEWTLLTKVNPTTFTDSPTNHLWFSAHGDIGGYPYWWVGYNPPSIIIEVVGIELKQFVASSQTVFISWECDDANATNFVVECRNSGVNEWTELTSTTNKSITVSGFFIDRTTQWRVSSTVEGDSE